MSRTRLESQLIDEQHESYSLVRAQKYEANYNQAKRQSIVDKNFLDEKAGSSYHFVIVLANLDDLR